MTIPTVATSLNSTLPPLHLHLLYSSISFYISHLISLSRWVVHSLNLSGLSRRYTIPFRHINMQASLGTQSKPFLSLIISLSLSVLAPTLCHSALYAPSSPCFVKEEGEDPIRRGEFSWI